MGSPMLTGAPSNHGQKLSRSGMRAVKSIMRQNAPISHKCLPRHRDNMLSPLPTTSSHKLHRDPHPLGQPACTQLLQLCLLTRPLTRPCCPLVFKVHPPRSCSPTHKCLGCLCHPLALKVHPPRHHTLAHACLECLLAHSP
jgi:hypothetical protein